MIRRLAPALKCPVHLTRRSVRRMWELQQRECMRLQAEMSQVRGLMRLLMKQRNGQRWDQADRRALHAQLRTLASLGPYMILFVSPGGFLALPLLAWWLDRRRRTRPAGAQQASAEKN